jgi:hypothetical protein
MGSEMEMEAARAGKAREKYGVPSYSPEVPSLHRWHMYQTKDKDYQPNPHEGLAPGSQKSNKSSIVCMPAATIEVRKEGVRCFVFLGIFSIQ